MIRMKYSILFLIALTYLALSGCSAGVSFDDNRNERLSMKRIINAHPSLANANINTTSFQGNLLITGQVSSKELIAIASNEVKKLRNVKKLYNQLAVLGETSLLSKTNDVLINNRVKSELRKLNNFDHKKIKIVTEYGVVYLMGKLTAQESRTVLKAAKSTRGAQNVISLNN